MAFDRDKSGRGIYVCIVQAEAWKLLLFLPEPLRRSHGEIAIEAMRFSEARVGRTGGFFFPRIRWLGAAEPLTAFLA